MSQDDRWTDLHIHTTNSDGAYSVEEVFDHAKKGSLQAIAITDHDTTAGVEEAKALSKKYSIEFIPGVELSASHKGKEVHIIGLYVDPDNAGFSEKLEYFQKKRADRAEKIIMKLKAGGIIVDFKELYEVTGNMKNAGRVHVAKLLVKKNIVRNIREAFNKFLAEDRPAYVKKAKLTVAEAISLVKGAGGVSILAHPVLVGMDEMIKKWKEQGLDGIEAFHPDHKPADTQRYVNIAGKYGLLISGGSDCHGAIKGHTRIGKIRLPYCYYEEIKNHRQAAAADEKVS